MAVDLAYAHIEKKEGEPARLEKMPRVRVAQIAMDYLTHGWSVEEMCRQHPCLSLAEAHSAMAYFFDHQDEICGEIEAELAQLAKDRSVAKPSAFLLRMRAAGVR